MDVLTTLMDLLTSLDVTRVLAIVLAVAVLAIAMIRDFNGVARPLAAEAIEFVEAELAAVLKDGSKLEAAVDFVADLLPLPYRLLVPRAAIRSFVQGIFDRYYAARLDQSKRLALKEAYGAVEVSSSGN